MYATCWLNAHIFESPLCSGYMSFGGVPCPVKSRILAIVIAQWAQLTVSIPRKRQFLPLVRSWFRIFRVYKQQPSNLGTQSILAQTAPRRH